MNSCGYPHSIGVTLSEFIDGKLNDRQWDLISEHIASCEICQKEVEELRQSMEALRGLPETDPGLVFNARVLERVQSATPEREAHDRRSLFIFRFAGAFAAMLFIAVLAIPVYVANIKALTGWQDVYVIGKETLIPGSTASMRVVVADHGADNPIKGANVKLYLKPLGFGRSIRLMSGSTNEAGTLDGNFKVPENLCGEYKLVAASGSYLGKDRVTFNVDLKREAKVLLTTDKPVYQPGQTIHIRTLSLLRPSLAPAAGDAVEITIEDPKGNKVFDKNITASRFGVAAADFTLGDEINSGDYRIKAVLGKTVSEKAVNVKRYVLPKFKVELKTDKTFYAPGDTIKGTVTARYFFGKPVDSGVVEVVLRDLAVNYRHFADVQGRTDANGVFTFERRLPDRLVGQPLEQGNALVQIEAGVIDRASHREQVVNTAPVSSSPIRVAVVPESGQLEPGLENVVYVVTSYPDGRPARTTVSVSGDGVNDRAGTDELGIASFTVQAPNASNLELDISASDEAGMRVRRRFAIPVQRYPVGKITDTEISRSFRSILVRTDGSVYDTGDTAKLVVLSTRQNGPVYVDAVRDGQTVFTKTIYLKDGKAEEDFDLSKDFAGTVTFSAYMLSSTGSPVRDTATVLVREKNELNVAITPDKDTYRPGDKANLRLKVTDAGGSGVVSAVGIDIVDESVFSVEEQAPGLAALYFALQEEILKPRYQVKELDSPETMPQTKGKVPGYISPQDLFLKNADSWDETVQRAGKVLFAGAVYAGGTTVYAETAMEKIRKLDDIQDRFFGYEGFLIWVIAALMLLVSVGCTVKSYKERAVKPFIMNVIPGLILLVMLIQLYIMATVDPYASGCPWIDQVLLGALFVFMWVIGIASRYEGFSVGKAIALTLLLLLIGAVLFPVFYRAKSASPDSVFLNDGSELGMAGATKTPAASPIMPESEDAQIPKGEVVPPVETPVVEPPKAATPVRVRQFFPETLLTNPEVITDEQGNATVEVPIADSITTWRASAVASSLNGQIGSATAGIKVFQDFFVDIDLPVGLTQGDKIEIPVAVYNYLSEEQTIRIALRSNDWFTLNGPAAREVKLAANEVGVTYFPVTAKGLGKHTLTVDANGKSLADAIKREITVWPNGEEHSDVIGGRISGPTKAETFIPEYAIRGGSKLLVKIYPGVYSQVLDGLDGLLQVPHGCFEQTSSVTYPNVLVLQYLKAVKKDSPQAVMKAEQFINLGYQRLLAFEVKGGGFDWYGESPANTVLTAYGVMEFADMAKVYDVDKRVIDRARALLLSRQRGDGSWPQDMQAHDWRQLDATLPVTAYVVWALAEAGYADSYEVRAGVDYLAANVKSAGDQYILALITNALVSVDPDSEASRYSIDRLASMASVKGDRAHWKSEMNTLTYGMDNIAEVETTALAAYAFLKAGAEPELAEKALNELVATRGAYGYWGSTQATILALKALVLGSTVSGRSPDSTVEVAVNGRSAGMVDISGDKAEIMQVIDATRFLRPGGNRVELKVSGRAKPAYQVVAKYYIPWSRVNKVNDEPIKIEANYGSMHVRKDSVVDLSARITSSGPVKMAIVDLGIPPGFTVMSEDLETLKSKRVIDRYELTGRQIILYMRNFEPGKTVSLRCRLRAMYPVTVSSQASRAYDYYNPDKVKGIAKPVVLRVD